MSKEQQAEKQSSLVAKSEGDVTTITNVVSDVTITLQHPTNSLEDARALFTSYLEGVKRARVLDKALEGDFATGKHANEAEKLASVEQNRVKMTAQLGFIYSEPGELENLRNPIARIMSNCKDLVGAENFERIIIARRNVPKLAEEFLGTFGEAVVVEMTRNSQVQEIESQIEETLSATA
jgi:hypothetical protein